MKTGSQENKTEKVRSRVFRAILQGDFRPGDRIPPERRMAELTGTSRITVRRAYAALERAGVLERSRGRGTHISTALRGHSERPDLTALLAWVQNPFMIQFVTHLEAGLAERNSLLILKLTDEDPAKEEQAAVDLVARGIRNLIVWPSGRAFPESALARLRVLGVNIVVFDRVVPGPYADFVGLDNRHGVHALLEQAWRDGCREALFIGHGGLDIDSARQRQEQFTAECGKRNIPQRVVRVPWRGDTRAALRRNARRWFSTGSALAVVCVHDPIALHVAEQQTGARGIYSIDGSPEAVTAGVWTYRQPMREMAERCIELLCRQQRQGTRWRAKQRYCRGELIRPARAQTGAHARRGRAKTGPCLEARPER